MFSGLDASRRPAQAAASARAAFSRSSPVGSVGEREAKRRTALASPVRFVELGREGLGGHE